RTADYQQATANAVYRRSTKLGTGVVSSPPPLPLRGARGNIFLFMGCYDDGVGSSHTWADSKNCKALADADPRTSSKWEEGSLMLARIGNAISEPLWIELTCVFSPDGGIMVNEDDGQDKVHAGRIFDSTEHHFLFLHLIIHENTDFILTIFRRFTLSKSGLALPKWFNTSSLAFSCHSGCMLSTINVHLSPFLQSKRACIPRSYLRYNLKARLDRDLPKWPNLFDKTSLTDSGSGIITLGTGPNQKLPFSFTTLWSMGRTRGMISWHPSGSGFVRASRLSRTFSLTSPVKGRYLVPLRPWPRRARSSRRGVHHVHSSDGESSKEKRWRMEHIAILASSNAKFWPMHILGPPPNGKNAA
ncbi:hypothetical protein U9M48_018362, partial [Paspalum notatum var. saurae]